MLCKDCYDIVLELTFLEILVLVDQFVAVEISYLLERRVFREGATSQVLRPRETQFRRRAFAGDEAEISFGK